MHKQLTPEDLQTLFERTAQCLAEHDGSAWSMLEFEAVSGAIERFRYKDGSQPRASAKMLRTFAAIGRLYKLNGYQVAADLDHLRVQVESGRAQAPETAAWFSVTTMRRLGRARKIDVARATGPATASEGASGWSDTRVTIERILSKTA